MVMVVVARWAGLSVSETLSRDFHTTTECQKKKATTIQRVAVLQALPAHAHPVGERGQRRMIRLVQADRKSSVTTFYNRAEQKSMLECTAHQSLRQMGYKSTRPYWILLLSAKNRWLELAKWQSRKFGRSLPGLSTNLQLLPHDWQIE